MPKHTSMLRKKRRMSTMTKIHLCETNVDKEYDFKSNHICFDPNIRGKIYDDREKITFYPVSQLQIIDKYNGIECRDTNNVLQFLLLPRNTSIDEGGKKKNYGNVAFFKG